MYGFSPVWILICLSSFDRETKLLLQIWQSCGPCNWLGKAVVVGVDLFLCPEKDEIWAPSWENLSSEIWDKVRLEPACSYTEFWI